MYKGKNVLVAGGTGTIGIPTVKRLVERGAHVTVVALDDPKYARELLGPDVVFKQADLTSMDQCQLVMDDQEIVFNLVGIKGNTGIGTSLVASYFVPMILYQTNMMDAAFRAGIERFLFVSSVCAYPQGDLHEEDNLWEGLPKQNDRYAGIAKRVGEIQGETYRLEHEWDAVRVIRPANVFGPFDDFNPSTAQVIPALISRALSGEDPLVVWGDGSAVRDFVFSEDVADAALLSVEKAPAGIPINIGSGRGVTIKELAETVVSLVPGNPNISWDVTKPAGDPIRLLATERAKQLLDYSPTTTLPEGIKKTIEWYVSNSELASRRKGVLNAGK
ncbi:MAG: SDR family NAD(P)-dependent oxidoreductase [Dehalococcoidia bacterium]